jgi:hypothetical protein
MLVWAVFLAPVLANARAVAADEEVRVCVIAILASQRDKKVDPRLTCIAKELRKMYPELTGFRLARDDGMSCQSVAVGARKLFKLPENESAVITVERAADKDNRVRLKVRPPRMKAITYTCPCGKFLPIVTPIRTKVDDLLIIAVRVTPCHCD